MSKLSYSRLTLGIAGGILALATAIGGFALRPGPANAAQYNAFSGCSQAAAAGDWGYTYNGNIMTQSGAVPVASVGRFTQDAAGHVKGTQNRSLAGTFGFEEIRGQLIVKSNCTAEMVAAVYQAGVLQRTAHVDGIYDSSENHIRLIFEKLVNPDGSQIPVVITIDGTRL
jgi:hypothetical protein